MDNPITLYKIESLNRSKGICEICKSNVDVIDTNIKGKICPRCIVEKTRKIFGKRLTDPSLRPLSFLALGMLGVAPYAKILIGIDTRDKDIIESGLKDLKSEISRVSIQNEIKSSEKTKKFLGMKSIVISPRKLRLIKRSQDRRLKRKAK